MLSLKSCSIQELETNVRFLIPRLDHLQDVRMVRSFRIWVKIDDIQHFSRNGT